MLKRMLSLFLCLVMVISTFPAQAFATEVGTDSTEQTLETEPSEETTAPTEEETEPTEDVTVPTEAETEFVEEIADPMDAETEPTEEVTESTEPVEDIVHTEPVIESRKTFSVRSGYNEQYLQSQIDAGATFLEVPEDVHLVIENDFTIPSSVWQLSVYGSITVPDGVTLTYDGEIYLEGDNALVHVEEGGALVTFGLFIWLDGTVQIDGELVGFVCTNYINGEYKGHVSGVDADQHTLRFFVYSEAELREAAQIMAEGNHPFYYTLIRGPIVITEDLTLPGDCLYHLEESDLTVEGGRTLTIDGDLTVHQGTELINNGTIDSNDYITVYGTVNNNGTFLVMPDKFYVDEENGAVWNGNAPVIKDVPVENRLILDIHELDYQSTVWIDGVEYAVQNENDQYYVDLPDGNARVMTVYTYNAGVGQTRYPVGMKVWALAKEERIYTATRQEVFDDILQYSGMSIRVTGKKGIRMITSIEKNKKSALVSGGLAGYTLKEYGTVVAWASQLGDRPLVLGESYVRSNYAYKKGVADPVFAYDGDLMQYTNVLVGFSNAQCKDDLAMRPYMILEDENGETVTLYGGIVQRSIGYIAYQNRNVFEPQTEEYDYIWNIIHYVYGDVYDDEFIHAWTPPSK